jgi:hypothetical protein
MMPQNAENSRYTWQACPLVERRKRSKNRCATPPIYYSFIPVPPIPAKFMLDFADYSDGIDWDMLADVLR